MEKLSNEEIILKLQSEDVDEKREIIEQISTQEFSVEIVQHIVKLLVDENSGVRDAVSLALIQNPKQEIPKLVVPYISSTEIAVRNLAGEILLKKGVSSLPAMLEYLKKSNDDDQKFLIDIMGLIGDIKPEEAIIDVLKKSQNENVILACLEGLGNIKSNKSVDLIKQKYVESELYHPTIFEALGKIGSDEALRFINDKYQEADDLSKFAMIESLGLVGNEEIFYTLLSEIKTIKGPLTWAIIESLVKLKEKLKLDIPFDESIKNTLVLTMSEADDQYKIAASKLVKDYTDKDIIKVCLEIYGTNDEIDSNVKHKFFEDKLLFYKMFILVFGKSQNEKSLIELFTEVLSEDNGEKLQELSSIDFRNLCSQFTNKLESADEDVRRNAMELLFFLCYDTAIMFLDVMVEDNNSWNKMRLLDFFEQIQGEEILPSLEKLTKDSDDLVSDRAKTILSSKREQ